MVGMKNTTNRATEQHLIGDHVSVRCARGGRAYRPWIDKETDVQWFGGRIIGRDGSAAGDTRYVVQLDDQRRVVAFDDDVRRWTLAFEIVETLERMAS
jgi:hypothetical protein